MSSEVRTLLLRVVPVRINLGNLCGSLVEPTVQLSVTYAVNYGVGEEVLASSHTTLSSITPRRHMFDPVLCGE